MAAQFHEERLELGVLYASSGGPEFSTEISIVGSGFEQANSVWSNSRGSWDLGSRVLNKDEVDYLVNFFRSKLGKAIGFRWKDFSDYKLVNASIGTGTGSATIFQIYKKYSALAATIETRNITKPVAAGFSVKVNNVVVTNYTVDLATGKITFNSPPGPGLSVTVTCEFDVPVRFNVDKLTMSFLAYEDATGQALFDLGSLPVVEIRV